MDRREPRIKRTTLTTMEHLAIFLIIALVLMLALLVRDAIRNNGARY